MKVIDRSSIPLYEQGVVLLDQYPWSIGMRIGLGFMIPYVLRQLSENEQRVGCLIGSFVAILFLLRLGPIMVRRLIPFSKETHLTWAERRQLAKRFDSYQWQKLFWMGIGMAGYAMILGNVGNMMGTLIVFCLIGGGLGVLFWVRRNESAVSVNIG